jgi:hypothetical protein
MPELRIDTCLGTVVKRIEHINVVEHFAFRGHAFIYPQPYKSCAIHTPNTSGGPKLSSCPSFCIFTMKKLLFRSVSSFVCELSCRQSSLYKDLCTELNPRTL